MTRAGIAVIAGLVVAPLVTWFPMLAHRFPALGLPAYPPAPGVDLWHLQSLWLVALGVIALLVDERDRWLGVAIALAGLTVFYRGFKMDPTHSVIFALGALCLYAVRTCPVNIITARNLIVASGAFQIAYLIQQHLGYDLLWGPVFGGTLNAQMQPLGTLGGVDASAAYVAIIAPLMPLWMLPFAALVVWTSHSLGAVGALIVGMGVHWWPRRVHVSVGGASEPGVYTVGGIPIYRPRGRAIEFILIAATIVTVAFSASYLHKETQGARVGIWTFAAHQWAASQDGPVLGWGLGGWSQRIPQMQQDAKYAPTGELWREAHNEPLQWIVETGLVGLLVLGLWLWDHRRMFAHPILGGSLAAALSSCLTWHPLHIVSSALLIITLVGLATREETPCVA